MQVKQPNLTTIPTRDAAVSVNIEGMVQNETMVRHEDTSEYISDSEEESKQAQSVVQESVVEELPPEEPMQLSDDVDIVLLLDSLSPATYHFSMSQENEVLCSVPRNISPDDLVFEVTHH